MVDPAGRRPVPVRDAATVMLVRDGPAGLEVCMLQRNLRSDFVGGAYVFPGGAVDRGDLAADVGPVCRGRTDGEASRLLDVPGGGLAYWVAAIRESFEEAGILLAYRDDGTVVRFDDPVVADRFVAHRHAVDRGERRLVEVCATEGLTLAVDTMHYVGRWITPPGGPRRYDTRFFLSPAPEAQHPVHDDREVISALWVRPDDALVRSEAGDFVMLPPTVASLHDLARFGTAAEALAHARAAEITAVAENVSGDG